MFTVESDSQQRIVILLDMIQLSNIILFNVKCIITV